MSSVGVWEPATKKLLHRSWLPSFFFDNRPWTKSYLATTEFKATPKLAMFWQQHFVLCFFLLLPSLNKQISVSKTISLFEMSIPEMFNIKSHSIGKQNCRLLGIICRAAISKQPNLRIPNGRCPSTKKNARPPVAVFKSQYYSQNYIIYHRPGQKSDKKPRINREKLFLVLPSCLFLAQNF